jgi:hypothetical protein
MNHTIAYLLHVGPAASCKKLCLWLLGYVSVTRHIGQSALNTSLEYTTQVIVKSFKHEYKIIPVTLHPGRVNVVYLAEF